MPHRAYEQRSQRAALWSFGIGFGLVFLVGWYWDWPVAWYWLALGGLVMGAACFNGWQKGAAQQAILEQQDRERAREE